ATRPTAFPVVARRWKRSRSPSPRQSSRGRECAPPRRMKNEELKMKNGKAVKHHRLHFSFLILHSSLIRLHRIKVSQQSGDQQEANQAGDGGRPDGRGIAAEVTLHGRRQQPQ